MTATVNVVVRVQQTRLLYSIQYEGGGSEDNSKIDAVEDMLWGRLLGPGKERITITTQEKIRVLVAVCGLTLEAATKRVQHGSKRITKRKRDERSSARTRVAFLRSWDTSTVKTAVDEVDDSSAEENDDSDDELPGK